MIQRKRKVMTYEKQQKVFDEVKWFDSINAGADMCGTYEFCAKCKKQLTYPCARAQRKHENGDSVRVAVVKRKRAAN